MYKKLVKFKTFMINFKLGLFGEMLNPYQC